MYSHVFYSQTLAEKGFSTRSGKATPPVTALKAHSLSGVEQFAEAFRRGSSHSYGDMRQGVQSLTMEFQILGKR
jgi:hypothetical protein